MLISVLSHVSKTVTAAIHKARTKAQRSSKWNDLQALYLTWNPTCAACGGTEKLNVHHVIPFNVAPEMELDSDNLVTLCMAKDKHCHLLIGHGGNFKYYNPSVRSYAYRVLESRKAGDDKRLKSIEQMSRRNRIKDLPKWNGLNPD